VEGFILFSKPVGEAVELAIQPRVESWECTGHPAQLALGEYLDHVQAVLRPLLQRHMGGDLAISLEVGLPSGAPLIGAGEDLDNYLLPVVRRLGPDRFASAWAGKHPGRSTICLQPALPAPADVFGGWRFASARTTCSSQSRAWKEQILAQLPPVQLSDEPLELQLCFRLGPHRNWAALWKPAIDSLGAILGMDQPDRPFNPRDDRVTHLGLHRNIDPALGHEVEIGIWWRPVNAPGDRDKDSSDGWRCEDDGSAAVWGKKGAIDIG
jgi:hypothetical protein